MIEQGLRGGAVTLFSGEPGIGKTRLLQHALQLADARGWSKVIVAPDVDSTLSPLGALLEAAASIEPPLLPVGDLAPILHGAAPAYWLTRLMADGLERAARGSGVLLIVDDLQWLDPGSLGALTALVHDLQGIPISWILATRTGVYSPAHERFIARIAEAGTVVEVAPLETSAAEALARDALGRMPGPHVANAISQADGYPLLILEILHGLEEDGRLRLTRGLVDIDDSSAPVRFGTSASERLRHLSPGALRIAQVGSLYGRAFPLAGILDVLELSSAEAAGPVQELLDQGFIIDTGLLLAFRHDSVQAAATDSLSPSLRRAMMREVIHRRLRAGDSVASLAASVASVVEAGDEASLELLFLAATQVARTDVQGAADLVILGARLAAGAAGHAERIAAMLPLVLASGRGEDAMEITRLLKPHLDADARARLHLALARQLTEADFDGAIRETSMGLAVPGVSEATRVELLAVRALNFANAANETELRGTLAEARSVADEDRDGLALATIDATESVLAFYQDRFEDAERLQIRALERVERLDVRAGLWLPEGLWMAFMKNSTGECEEALRLTDEGLDGARAAKNPTAAAYWMMVRSRVLYHLGRLEEARAQAETVLEIGEQLGLGDFMNATAGVVLHRVSLRTGDVALRDVVRPLVQKLADGVGLSRTGNWSLAMEDLERMRPGEAYEHSKLAIATLRDATPSMTTPADFADDFVLAYVCQLAGDRGSVELVAEIAHERAHRNPGNAFIEAVAHATRGIRDRSAEDLLVAAELMRGTCRPLVTGTLFEAVGIFAEDDSTAISALTEALGFFSRCGATRDATRVLQMLRSKGVYQRLVGEADETGLSQRERQVAAFISSGLTTQEMADELLVSPHTVVTYIRHIYAKWGVNTRKAVAERFRGFSI